MEDLIEKYKGYLDENLDEQLEEELDEQLEEELGERDAIITKALIQNEIKSTPAIVEYASIFDIDTSEDLEYCENAALEYLKDSIGNEFMDYVNIEKYLMDYTETLEDYFDNVLEVYFKDTNYLVCY